MKDATYLVNDLRKEREKRPHEPNRAFRMCFPILKHMALNMEPLTAYTLENTNLEIMRNGKTEKARIDKATIFKSLRLLEQAYLVKSTERKVCRGGRIRKKFVATPQGVVALLQGYPNHVGISKQYVRNLAETQKSFLPLIFGKWNYFIQQQLEDEAYKSLLDSAKLDIFDMVYPLELLNKKQKNPFGPAWIYVIQEASIRHAIYGRMLIYAWYGEDSPRASDWLKAIRSDKELLEMARKEVLRYRLEEELEIDDWDAVLKDLDSGELSPRLNLLEGSTDKESDFGMYRWMYRYVVAAQIDQGETPLSFRDLTFAAIDEYVNRRECPECGQINATSSFQLAKQCEQCGTRLDPIRLQR